VPPKNVQATVGEVIAWRNLFWGLTDAMTRNPVPWSGATVLPNPESAQAYRVFAPVAYPRIRELTESILASGLIYLYSHAVDFKSPARMDDILTVTTRTEKAGTTFSSIRLSP